MKFNNKDYPINNITAAEYIRDGNRFALINSNTKQPLFLCDPCHVVTGDYVLLVKEGGNDIVYRFTTPFEFETLRRDAILATVRNRLAHENIDVVDFGLLYNDPAPLNKTTGDYDEKAAGRYVNGRRIFVIQGDITYYRDR